MSEVDDVRVFAAHRPTLVGVAYRILGSVADAEDLAQETWLRWSGHRSPDVVDARAYLIRVAARLALDRLRRVRARRESYVGPWLPEPLLTGPDAAERIEMAESVSLALLVVLETLSPLERVVFVLREAFGLPYAEIAATLERSEPAVRQLGRRARAHVEARRPRFEADEDVRRETTERFLTACRTADLTGLVALLAPDVTLVSDGGGQARAPRRPVVGSGKVARLLVVGADSPELGLRYAVARLNDEPGIVVTSHGTPVAALVLEVHGGLVAAVYAVANPDKLAGISHGAVDLRYV